MIRPIALLGRHISARILSSFLVILSVLTLALAAMQFVRLGPLLLGPWVRPGDGVCLAALVPFLALGIPAALALACALVAGSMSRRGERQAVSAAGVSPLGVALSPLLLALVGGAVTAALTTLVVPRAFGVLERSVASLATRAALGSLPEGRFFELPAGGVLFAGSRNGGGLDLVLEDVLVGYETGDAGPSLVVTAPRARITHLRDGASVFRFADARLRISTTAGESVEVEAGELALPVDLGALVSSRSDALPPVLASPTSELLAGAHGATGRYHLHRRLALPAASFAILVMAVLFFVMPSLRRPQAPAAVTASALVVFHALTRAGEESSISGLLDPLIAAWLPAAVLGTAALATLWLVVRARAPSRAASS